MRGKAIVVVALVLAGCAGAEESCSETRYSGGSLVDCGSTVTFRPRGAEKETANSSFADSIQWPASLLSLFPAEVAAQAPYTHCQTTEVPEGTWIVCDGGFSQLKRNAAAIAAYQREVEATKPTEEVDGHEVQMVDYEGCDSVVVVTRDGTRRDFGRASFRYLSAEPLSVEVREYQDANPAFLVYTATGFWNITRVETKGCGDAEELAPAATPETFGR